MLLELLLYNGDGSVYHREALQGMIPVAEDGLGALWFPIQGVQNGSPDGLALVGADGQVLNFISYEGTILATEGAAAGLVSQEIGVAEGDDTPVGLSLHLGADGQWFGPAPATPGVVVSESSAGPELLRFNGFPLASEDGILVEGGPRRGGSAIAYAGGELLRVGDDVRGGAWCGVVSFELPALPQDFTLEALVLELTLTQVLGHGDGALGPLVLDVAEGALGGGPSLEPEDFTAATGEQVLVEADALVPGGLMVSLPHTVDLSQGRLQVRLCFDAPSNGDSVADQVHFASGDAPQGAPSLRISGW